VGQVSDLLVQAGSLRHRPVVFEGDAMDCPVYRRESLASGERIDGPAIIQEYASTTALFPQDHAEVTASGELLVHVGGHE
jgi:N-methylhydantoinase A/oxoprolinase/acetone carboxylase beta subunit